jgi:nucleotide-binding universal stress UspA family protein
MKSILVCTDFSGPSLHAARYACMLAKEYRISYITLFHAYQVFIPAITLPVTVHGDDEIRKAALRQLQNIQKEVQRVAGPEVSVNVRADALSLPESINRVCQEENADLIVMGMKGKSNFEKALTGSTTIDVAESSYSPVWVVPENASIEPVRRLLIACDLSKVRQTVPVNLMHEILDVLKAEVTILNIDYKNQHFSPDTPDDLHQLHEAFDSYQPKYVFNENKDVVSGILEYAEENDISLIVAMPKNYNLFEQLFHKSTAEKLIYRSSVPLLTLHAP